MSKAALLAAIAGAALLAVPLGADAYTYRRPVPMRGAMPMHWGPGPMRAVSGGYGYRRLARGYGYRRPFGARYGVGLAAAAVGYGVGYGAAAGYGQSYGYGRSYSYGAGYGQSYGYSTRSTPYASGPYAPQPTGQCGCSPTAYQPVSTIAYVPVTSYKAVRVYYAPQQQPYYNVPPYAQQ